MRPHGETIACEAVVVGAGMAGLTLGAALAGAGIETAVIDRAPRAALADPRNDGRTTAIAAGSMRVLEGVGIWPEAAPHACPIESIRVSDGDSLLFLHYDHHEAGDEPLGYILENHNLRRAMFARADALPALHLAAGSGVAAIARGPSGAHVTLEDGTQVRGRVILACDGKRSRIREEAGIPVTRWDYDQSSIVCTIRHEFDHANIAHERFLPGGPFAVLPMLDGAEPVDGLVHRASIVWSESNDLVPAIAALDDATFMAELGHRLGDFLGRLALDPGASGAAGGAARWQHPLSLLHAVRYTGERLALVGDAAHAIHPIAGQGLNMGIRDIAALAEVIVDARRLGRDIGEADILAAYARWRRFDNMTLAVVTDVMNRLFSNDVAPLRLARDAGLAAVNATPPLRRFFMRHAMGTVGDLPRLVRGEAL